MSWLRALNDVNPVILLGHSWSSSINALQSQCLHVPIGGRDPLAESFHAHSLACMTTLSSTKGMARRCYPCEYGPFLSM